MSQRVLDRAHVMFGPKIISSHAFHGDETIVVEAEDIFEVLSSLRTDSEARLDFLVDLTAVDHYGKDVRFEVVYHLRSMATGERLRVKAELAEPDDGSSPEIATVCGLWKCANWMEREVFDMFGIKFKDHPDLRRILMYEEFIGHPLRKDYPKDKRQPLVRRDPNT
jgi:NADH-quinone oxidoreductase subunit C